MSTLVANIKLTQVYYRAHWDIEKTVEKGGPHANPPHPSPIRKGRDFPSSSPYFSFSISEARTRFMIPSARLMSAEKFVMLERPFLVRVCVFQTCKALLVLLVSLEEQFFGWLSES